jgi:hypothetical protein
MMRAQIKYITLSIVCGLLWPWNAFWGWVCYVSPEEDEAIWRMGGGEPFRRDLWRMMATWTTHFRQERIVAWYNLYFPNPTRR